MPQVDRRDMRKLRVSVERLRGRPLHRHVRDAELRHQLGLRRRASAITSPRTSSSRACTRRPRSATRRSARSCRAASSEPTARSSTTTTSRSATTSCPARCSSAAAGPAVGAVHRSAASAAPSSSTRTSRPSTSASAFASSSTDYAALQLDLRDHIFSLDLLGKSQSTQNLELTTGLSVLLLSELAT